MLFQINSVLVTLLVSFAAQALDYEAIITNAGNQKISKCKSVVNPDVSADIYTDMKTPFDDWYDSAGFIYMVISTTGPAPLGLDTYVMKFNFDGSGHGIGLWSSEMNSSTNVQFENYLPIEFFTIDNPESEWMEKLDIWNYQSPDGFFYSGSPFECTNLLQPN